MPFFCCLELHSVNNDSAKCVGFLNGTSEARKINNECANLFYFFKCQPICFSSLN